MLEMAKTDKEDMVFLSYIRNDKVKGVVHTCVAYALDYVRALQIGSELKRMICMGNS